MDLISRKAATETVKKLLYETALNSCGHHQDDEIYADIAENRIEVWLGLVHSVPAVPIKAISVWLAAYAAPPKYAIDEIAGTDSGRIVTVDTLVKAWEYHWKNLMECGLLQEEQNGTDNP